MFKRKTSEPSTPLKMVTVSFERDDGSFDGDDGQITVKGFRVKTTDGQYLEHSEIGQVADGVYLFRLAGATYHRKGANKLKGDSHTEILAIHQPNNPHDKNAIGVLVGGELAGFVPAVLAPLMLPHLVSAGDRQDTRGSVGMVVKTFHRESDVVGGEVIVLASGYSLGLTS